MAADAILYSNTVTPVGQDGDVEFIEIDDSELDRLFTAYNETSDLYSIVNRAMETGQGLDPLGLKIATISVKNIYERSNLDFSDVFLATENFHNKATRLSATRLSLESIAGDLVTIAKALWKAINYVWEKVKALLIKLYKKLKDVKKDFDGLLDEISEVPDNAKPTSPDLSVSTENHASVTPIMNRIPFAINGRCDGHTALRIGESTLTLVKSHLGIIERIAKCLENVAKNSTKEALTEEVDSMVDFIMQNLSKLELKHKKTVENKVEYTYGHLIAGKNCEVTEYIGKGHHETERRIFNLDVSITISDQSKVFIPAVLNKKEMQELAKQSIELIKAVTDLDAMIPEIDKALSKAEAYFFTKQDQHQSARIGLLVVRDLFRYTGATLPKLSIDSNRVATSVASYVRDSIAIYKV